MMPEGYPDTLQRKDKRCVRCRFIGSDGSTMSYHAENLWIPRRLADRLTGVLEQIADAAMVAAHREQK